MDTKSCVNTGHASVDCELQQEEITTLAAIYNDEISVHDATVSIELACGDDEKKEHSIHLEFEMPNQYPSSSPITFTISAPWMSRTRKAFLIDELKSIQQAHHGEPVMYLMIERAREILSTTHEELIQNTAFSSAVKTGNSVSCPHEARENVASQQDAIEIFTDSPFVDRKSVFQAHLALVNSTDQVNQVKSMLLQNKKIASATHNISAYRICSSNNASSMVQDCDDDGETAAGSRLLHLLVLLDVQNVLVVVSRWFGGIQLGPDRFKHINNVAREILEKHLPLKRDCSSTSNISSKDKKKKK